LTGPGAGTYRWEGAHVEPGKKLNNQQKEKNMSQYLAVITILDGAGAGGVPTPPIYYPPGVNVPVFPTHPIAPGGPPPGIWPSPGHPAHPIAPGGAPPEVWPSPGHPSHPIAPGGAPPEIWGPILTPEHPIYIPITPPADSGLAPTHPIYIPVYPSHPIVAPPTWEEIKDFIFGTTPPARPHPETGKAGRK
jgi:hypothetical protein